MKFDNTLSEINGFGKFQINLVLIQVLSRITVPCHFLLNNSMSAVPSHHCNISALDDGGVFRNLTLEQKLAVGVPAEQELLSDVFKAPLSKFARLEQEFGRRPLLLVSYLSSMMFAVLSAFSTSYIMFVIMRFFTGMSLAGITIISIVLNVEWCSTEHRTFAGIIISLDWTIGNWLLVGIAYGVNEWRMLILAVTSPLILSVIAWRWLPESARWLLANGKADVALHYIMKCAEMNNRTNCMTTVTPRALLESAQDENTDKKYTVVDLFKTPNIRKLSICSGIVWFGVAFTYYGISLNITGFGLNPYLTQFIFASIEMPMKIGVYLFLEKVGRKAGEMGSLLSTGLCLFINIFVPKDNWVNRTVVAVLGKSMSEASFTIMYLYYWRTCGISSLQSLTAQWQSGLV